MALNPVSDLYRPLETPTTIRLLHLKEVDGQMKCELSHHQLEEDIFFMAVSYTWVGAVPGSCLNINGTACEVSSNVESVLRRFFHERWKGMTPTDTGEKMPISVWIDGICIDQGDSAASCTERAIQIKLMDKIYKRAAIVVADLGESFYDGLLIPLLSNQQPYCMETTRQWLAETGLDLPTDYFKTEVRKALEDMIQRVFFHRVWIMQEFVLAEHVAFLIGEFTHSADRIAQNFTMAMLEHLDPEGNGEKFEDDAKVGTFAFMLMLRAMKGRNLPKFSAIVRRACGFDATREHDKIYGCLGLAPPTLRDEFHIDYSESLESLSQRVVRSLIKHERSVAVLYQAKGLLPDTHGCSWSLNMKKPHRLSTSSDRMLDAPNARSFTASLDSKQYWSPAMDQQSHILELLGYEIDRIAHIIARHEYSEPFGNYYTMLTEFSELIHSQPTTAIFTYDSFWRTVIQDHIEANMSEMAGGRAKPHHALYWLCYLCVEQQKISSLPHASRQSVEKYASYFRRSILSALYDKRLGISSRGHLVVVPGNAEIGDKILLILGGDYPFVFRSDQEEYWLLGRCYVHGLMDGEGMKDPRTPEVFRIV